MRRLDVSISDVTRPFIDRNAVANRARWPPIRSERDDLCAGDLARFEPVRIYESELEVVDDRMAILSFAEESSGPVSTSQWNAPAALALSEEAHADRGVGQCHGGTLLSASHRLKGVPAIYLAS